MFNILWDNIMLHVPALYTLHSKQNKLMRFFVLPSEKFQESELENIRTQMQVCFFTCIT